MRVFGGEGDWVCCLDLLTHEVQRSSHGEQLAAGATQINHIKAQSVGRELHLGTERTGMRDAKVCNRKGGWGGQIA